MSNRTEEVNKKRSKTPPTFLYWVLMLVVKILNAKTHTEFTYRAYPNKDTNPYVLISNHASRVDYQFTGPVCYPQKLNYVVGYNEFYRFPLNLILDWMQVIPKRNFTVDTNCIRNIIRIIKNGGHICIMPEGMSSITGMAQPVIPGGAKLIKKLGVTVYYTKVSGAYLTYTKHCLDERIGKIEVVVDKMFTPEQLHEMSEEEIENRMNQLLAHDDYLWNKKKQVRFNGKGQMAKNLDTLLYMCPKCGSRYKMKTSGNSMQCQDCNNIVGIDECYNIYPSTPESMCPEVVSDWTIMEREEAKKLVSKTGFVYSEHVKIGALPKKGLLKGSDTSIICGEGVLRLDHQGLHFEGVKDNEKFCFDISSDQVPTFGMCTDISRFYTFVEGEFIEFYPDNNDVLFWDHLTEELHRYNGGKWQNTPYRDYELD